MVQDDEFYRLNKKLFIIYELKLIKKKLAKKKIDAIFWC